MMSSELLRSQGRRAGLRLLVEVAHWGPSDCFPIFMPGIHVK